ncbi:S1C family serine protease [Thermodesulfobacteriota bacterium]
MRIKNRSDSRGCDFCRIMRAGVLFLLLFSVCGILLEPYGYPADKRQIKNSPEATGLVLQLQKIRPSVVAIGTYSFRDKPKAQFLGTGFAVSDGTLIVTNAHTMVKIEKTQKLKHLRIFHKQFSSHGVKCVLLHKDEIHDLALLKIQKGELPPLPLGDSSQVMEGESVAFTGYPLGLILGLNPTTHAGIIAAIAPIVIPSPTASTIKKEIIKFLRHPYDIFQLDATAYPGNSGSPVFRISNGEVIGVVNMVFVKGKKEHLLTMPSGITYAIPVNFVHTLIKEGTKP